MVSMLVQAFAKAAAYPGKNFEVVGPAAGACRKQGTEPASVIISGNLPFACRPNLGIRNVTACAGLCQGCCLPWQKS